MNPTDKKYHFFSPAVWHKSLYSSSEMSFQISIKEQVGSNCSEVSYSRQAEKLKENSIEDMWVFLGGGEYMSFTSEIRCRYFNAWLSEEIIRSDVWGHLYWTLYFPCMIPGDCVWQWEYSGLRYQYLLLELELNLILGVSASA